MKKNPFLTFIFACIPGAGQMYYGYMQRGLSLITLFCLCFGLGLYVSPLVMLSLIVWMYSFFDTYDLIRYLVAGQPKEDCLLIVGDADRLKTILPQHNKLLGWVLIGFGAWTLYNSVVEPLLAGLLTGLFGSQNAVWRVLDAIPTLVVAVLFVLGGLWLLGLHPGKQPTGEPLPNYPAPLPEEAAPDADALAKLRAELDAGVPPAPEMPPLPESAENPMEPEE